MFLVVHIPRPTSGKPHTTTVVSDEQKSSFKPTHNASNVFRFISTRKFQLENKNAEVQENTQTKEGGSKLCSFLFDGPSSNSSLVESCIIIFQNMEILRQTMKSRTRDGRTTRK
jgi:hypothetical protein